MAVYVSIWHTIFCYLLLVLRAHHEFASSLRMAATSMRTTSSTPSGIASTKNYLESASLSKEISNLRVKNASNSKKVVIIGGGLSGLACAKYLTDAGHQATVLEARDVLGGKVSAWQDKDGDWIETGLHIFFGAYPNMMNLFRELKIEDRLQWKKHQMTFAMPNLPGTFTKFAFTPGVPAPFNMALAILGNTEMLTLSEKILMVPALLPMLTRGQDFINEQDELSVLEFMRKYGMPERVNDEIFIAMSKALDFIDPEKLSMTVILTAMNRFINEADGSQTAFLDGNAPDRLCGPMKEYIEANGGKVELNTPVLEILVDDKGSKSVTGLKLHDGTIVEADEYVSAMPVDVFKKLIPESWSNMPYFMQTEELKGIPVMNLQIWFDRKFKNSVDGLVFSRSPLLSVYADMSTCCEEYSSANKSMLELVFAPCSPEATSDAVGSTNWMACDDKEIFEATMKELERLFPEDLLGDDKANVIKHTVVRVPRSVYAAVPGRNKYRPSQKSPIPNFTLAGDWTSQKFLGSMEGAVLAGKLAAAVISKRSAGVSDGPIREVTQEYIEKSRGMDRQKPKGIVLGRRGEEALSFGGGVTRSTRAQMISGKELLEMGLTR